MDVIKKINLAMWMYLKAIPTQTWARHAFTKESKIGHCTNNMTESWTSSLGVFRGYPILDLFEGIRRKVMTSIAVRNPEGKDMTNQLLSTLATKLEIRMEKAGNLRMIWYEDGVFEVLVGLRTYVVNLKEGKCDCGEWEVSVFPCVHVLKCLHEGDGLIKYVDVKLQKFALEATYKKMIRPIHDPEKWSEMEVVQLDPPVVKKQLGRPRTTRRKKPGSRKSTRSKHDSIQCSEFHEYDHNKRGCPICHKMVTRENTLVSSLQEMPLSRTHTSGNSP